MRQVRLFLPVDLQPDTVIHAPAERAHYVLRVLRKSAGDELLLFNGDGRCMRGEITVARKNELTIRIIETVGHDAAPAVRVTLALALTKGDALDYALQKCTELGATGFVLFQAQRCERHFERDARGARQLQHWQNVLIAACEQCGRNALPALGIETGLAEVLDTGGEQERWLLHPTGTPLAVDQAAFAAASWRVVVGPEGGFTDAEVELASRRGWQIRSLGPRILRADTAPTVALTILQFQYGGLS